MHEQPADHRELRIVDPPERDGRQCGRHDKWQQDYRAQERCETHMLVEEHCKPEAQHELEDTGDDRVEQRVEEGQPRNRVAPEEDVVLEADEFPRPSDLRIGESEPDAESQRICQENEQQQRGREHEERPQRVAAVLQSLQQRARGRCGDPAVWPTAEFGEHWHESARRSLHQTL